MKKTKDLTKCEKSMIHCGGPNAPKDKVAEALTSMLDPEQEHKEGSKYEFTHVTMSEVIEESQPGILFDWGAKGIGFGQIAIATHDGKLTIDDECMSKEFIKEMFGHLVDEYYKKEGE